jgi:hypothetical protein
MLRTFACLAFCQAFSVGCSSAVTSSDAQADAVDAPIDVATDAIADTSADVLADVAPSDASVTCPGHADIAFDPAFSTCNVAADCVATLHGTSCCGDAEWVGVNASQQATFSAVEMRCRTAIPYSACGCPSGPPTAQDGRIVMFGTTPPVRCSGGVCLTYAP